MSDEVYYRKKEVFYQYKGGHDRLTICGLESLVKKNNPKRGKSILEIVPRLYAAYDRNQDRVISFEEYLLIETVFASEDIEAAVGLMFDVIDIDKSGYLDREELEADDESYRIGKRMVSLRSRLPRDPRGMSRLGIG